jgi:hypothetical protein
MHARAKPLPSDQEPALALFRFGNGAGTPLSLFSGGLILDQGEAERSFIYRCQDRFLTYAGLHGLRSLFFAIDETHIAVYRTKVMEVRQRFLTMAGRTGLFAQSAPQMPLFILADPMTLAVHAPIGLRAQLADSGLVDAALAGMALNQISPSYAHLLSQTAALLNGHGLKAEWPCDRMQRMAMMAMRLHDKAIFAEETASAPDLVRKAHVATCVLSAAELSGLSSFQALSRLFADRTAQPAPEAFFIKASRNSAGNLAARLAADDFPERLNRLLHTAADEAWPDAAGLTTQVADLRRDIEDAQCLAHHRFLDADLRAFKQMQAGNRQELRFLVQPLLSPPNGDQRLGGLGLSYAIDADGRVQPFVISGQIYRDAEQRHFLGALLSDAIRLDVPADLLDAVESLAARVAAAGYRGPISFDARLDAQGAYKLIHDCNPRLTGVFPSVAVRQSLRQAGFAAATVLTLGYRGEFVFHDIDRVLDRLEAEGLLFTAQNPRGAVILPNLYRENGYDLHLIDVPLALAQSLIAPGGLLSRLSLAHLHPARLHH